jgi:hypothetical protein
MANTTYISDLQLNLSQVPEEILDKDKILYEELLDIHNAIERLAMGNLEITSFPVAPQFISTVLAASPLAVAAPSGSREITLDDSTGFLVGNSVTDLDSASNRILPIIIAVNANTLTLDRHIDGNFPLGAVVSTVSTQLNVVGNPITPVVFTVAPPPGTVWHVTRMMIAMTHATRGDMGLYGDLPALTYGVVGKVQKSGQALSFTNWKSNAGMALSMYDVRFDERSGGGGDFGTTGRFTFTEAGTLIELDGDQGDKMEILIQDDLSSLDTYEVTVHGHIEV